MAGRIIVPAFGLALVTFLPDAQAQQSVASANSNAGVSAAQDATRVGLEESAVSAERRLTSLSDLEARMEARGFSLGAPAFVRIFKRRSQLELWLAQPGSGEAQAGSGQRFTLFKTYDICKWSGKIGPKLAEGDHQSPEGFYAIEPWQLRRWSKNHRAIEIGFPNAFDRANGRTGSHIQIHGGCGSEGCFAMTDRGVEEIFDIVRAALQNGQARVPLHIFPFRMSEDNIASAEGRTNGRDWAAFWGRLLPAYTQFEETRRVPEVTVCGKGYAYGEVGKGCVAPWHGARKHYLANNGATPTSSARKKARRPQITVHCNLRLASCKRWLHLAHKRLARGGQARALSLQERRRRLRSKRGN